MSYVPPHKRHSSEPVRPSPVPVSVSRKFNSNLNLNSRRSSSGQDKKIVCAKDCMWRWLLVSSNGTEDKISPSIELKSVSSGSAGRSAALKPFVLVNNDIGEKIIEVGATVLKTPWLSVAEKVEDDIVSAFELAKSDMDHRTLDAAKLRLVSRFGKVLFHGHPSFSLESSEDGLVSESSLRKTKKSFYTNVPSSYMENIKCAAVTKLGFGVEEKKDIYYVKLSDNTRPQSTISCKCTMKEDERLSMYKAELNAVRHLVVDVSCLDQNIDVRLMVDSKTILTDLTDDEICSIRKLIDSAVVDPNVKGGLRWPLGKISSGDRYSTCGVWHTTITAYRSPTLKLKVREADRFDFRTGTGEAASEVLLILKGVSNKLGEQEVERSSVSDMLKDALKMIWEHFLSADPYLA